MTFPPTLAGRRHLHVLTAFGLSAVTVILGRIALRDFSADSELFHPHGYCYLWLPDLVAAHVIADLLIGASYVAISGTLVYLVYQTRRQTPLPFDWMFVAFGAFIIACGATHFVEVLTLWQPLFWLAADVKIVTAAASVATAVLLPPLVPRVLRVLHDARLPEQRRVALEQARAELEQQVEQRTAELRHALELANESNQMKEAFLGIVSHELRTPLNAIVGWSRMLARDTRDSDFLRRGLTVIDRNARIQAELVEDLLDVSRISAGTLTLQLAAVDLDRVAADAVDAVRPAAQARHITVTLENAAAPVLTQGDARRLQQIVWNLLTNAVKFTPPYGRVWVRVLTPAPGEAAVSVEDTGSGIDPAFIPRLFERFARADSRSVRDTQGLGIGLAIARQLAQLHGGDIVVNTAGAGLGATFTLSLPLVTGAVAGARPEVPPRLIERLDGLAVLVVDDMADSREAAALMLHRSGAIVATAASVDEAVAMLGDERRFDVIVSDLSMPGRDGYDLARTVRAMASTGDVPAIIALSAYARGEDRERALAAGFYAHLAKPVTPEDLVHTVASAVGL